MNEPMPPTPVMVPSRDFQDCNKDKDYLKNPLCL